MFKPNTRYEPVFSKRHIAKETHILITVCFCTNRELDNNLNDIKATNDAWNMCINGVDEN